MNTTARIQRPAMTVAEEYEHKDGRGSTTKYACGCSLVYRGRSIRRTYCTAHGQVNDD